MTEINPGDCVKMPDGKIGRVREIKDTMVKVRVMRVTSHTHQFLWFDVSKLSIIACPKGWMSPEGYQKYLKVTLQKMKLRNK